MSDVPPSTSTVVLRVIWLAIRLPIAVLIVYFNVNLWTLDPADYGPEGIPSDVVPSLEGIGRDLRAGAADEMQQLFPEGYVITHGIYGFSWVDVALRSEPGSPLRERALREARWAVSRIDTPKAREIFSASDRPPHGAFYRGYLNWLRGGILKADPEAPASEVQAFQQDCDRIAAAFEARGTPYLDSYPGMAWPGDSVFLVATLRLHDTLFEPKYEKVVDTWISGVRERLDPSIGMLPHSAASGSGEPLIPTRGLTAALQGRMLYEVDREFAAGQYKKMREHFVGSHLGDWCLLASASRRLATEISSLTSVTDRPASAPSDSFDLSAAHPPRKPDKSSRHECKEGRQRDAAHRGGDSTTQSWMTRLSGATPKNTSHLGIFPGIFEYRTGTSGSGDVDSGPLLFGYSGSATVVGIAAARLHGDRELADPLLVGAHAVGIPTGWGKTRRYGFGLLPVGEAFFVWAKTTTPWATGERAPPKSWSPVVVDGWRFGWHAMSLLVLALMFVGELRRVRNL